jgi:His/Glu/Gln/Arg/opine family amino acid ABC transporter permease subunit
MNYTFDWSVLWREPNGGLIIDGLRMTLYLSLSGWIGALFFGTLVGFGRTARAMPVRVLCTAYVEILRNIPLLLQLLFWYFAFPAMLPRDIRVHLYSFGWEVGAAIVALALYTSSRVAEHIRSGVRSVESGVGLAALATGLSRLQATRRVIAPLVFRLIAPSLASEFLTIFKSSSVAMMIGVAETTFVSQRIGNSSFRFIEASAEATVIYFAVAGLVATLAGFIELRLRVPGLMHREAN